MDALQQKRIRCQQMSDQQWEGMIDRIPLLQAVVAGEVDAEVSERVKDACLSVVLAEALCKRVDRCIESLD